MKKGVHFTYSSTTLSYYSFLYERHSVLLSIIRMTNAPQLSNYTLGMERPNFFFLYDDRWLAYISAWSNSCNGALTPHLCLGAYCRDGNNVTLDPAVCLSKLMDPFLQLELHRECSIPCHKRNHGPEFVASGCPSEEALASSAASGNLCPRNCIGTRILPGMFPCSGFLCKIAFSADRNFEGINKRVFSSFLTS